MTMTPQLTMAAIAQDRYGSADVLQTELQPVPNPGRGEVRLKVIAASVNRGDIHLMEGLPLMLRLFLGMKGPRQRTRGMDVAGIVDAVGDGVDSLAVGDEVFGVAAGSFAEFALARPSKLALKPASVSFTQAAAVAVAGCTALKGLRDVAGVTPGERVLVLGASGAVGTFAVQVAKSLGAHVTGVCRTSKLDAVRQLGADEVIDYTAAGITSTGQTWDVIFDIGGHRSLAELRRALTPRGTLVLVGSEIDAPVFGGFDRTLRAGLLSPLVRQRLVGLTSSETTALLEDLGRLIAAGSVTPRVDRVLPLAEAATAVRLVQDGAVTGKVVLSVG